jgi:hypothetical protein
MNSHTLAAAGIITSALYVGSNPTGYPRQPAYGDPIASGMVAHDRQH